MSKLRSRLVDRPDSDFRVVKSFTTVLHFGRQSKHLPRQSNYVPGKSVVTLDVASLQWLVEHKAGTGSWKASNKEIVDFGTVIGLYVDQKTGETQATSLGIIHYSNQGAHVVPAMPRNQIGSQE